MSPMMRSRLIARILSTMKKFEQEAVVQTEFPGMEIHLYNQQLVNALHDLDDDEIFNLACMLGKVDERTLLKS